VNLIICVNFRLLGKGNTDKLIVLCFVKLLRWVSTFEINFIFKPSFNVVSHIVLDVAPHPPFVLLVKHGLIVVDPVAFIVLPILLRALNGLVISAWCLFCCFVIINIFALFELAHLLKKFALLLFNFFRS